MSQYVTHFETALTQAQEQVSKSSYRPEIDGLRAFAVVAVIINHFNKDILPGGYLGVDIFFVISGYVITSSLYERPNKDFNDFISGFYERRIKRLVPALSVFVLITSIAICLFNPSPRGSLLTGLASLFGLSNIYLLNNSTDYFAQSTELNVFTHTWSLGVEEQFYILFPFLIWFSGFGQQTKNGARNLFLAVGALTIASLIGFLYLYPTNQPMAYFLMPSRFWEMAAGCLIFIGFQKRSSIEQCLEKVPPLLVIALIVGVMYLPMSIVTVATIAVVVLASILIASLKKQTAAFKIFTHPKVVYVGLISYSLYLWHWAVLSISRWSVGIHWWSVPLQVVLMLGLAVSSYRWIETPFRKRTWSISKRSNKFKTLSIGFIWLTLTSTGIYGIYKGSSFLFLPRYLGITGRLEWGDYLDCHGIEDIRKLPYPVEHCLKTSRSPTHPNRFYLLGDSHAAQFFFMANKTFEGSSFEVAFINTGVFIEKYILGIPPRSKDADELEEIRNHAVSGDIVAISFHRGHLNKTGRDTHTSAFNKSSIKRAFQKLREPLRDLAARGVRIILIRDVPLLAVGNRDITTCLLQEKLLGSNMCEISHSQDSLTRATQDELYNQLAIHLNIETWDPREYMLSNSSYGVNDASGLEMMWDQHHITKSYSEHLASLFKSDMFKMTGGMSKR